MTMVIDTVEQLERLALGAGMSPAEFMDSGDYSYSQEFLDEAEWLVEAGYIS